jgi:DMSO/TMAO reductase YedYZ molybdopterin-dependent catalytic subunit
MSPRGTDWSLAALVAALAVTGGLTLFFGSWVFAVHGAAGFALAAVLVWKLRRVRLRRASGVLALSLVALTLFTGWAWSSGARLSGFGYNALNLHGVLGFLLALAVLSHALARAKRPRVRDLSRRHLLVAGGAFVAWELQRPLARLLGWRGADRRYTGSYEVASFRGNAFPTTSWVADSPPPLSGYALRVEGRVQRPLTLSAAELDAGHRVVATLDCTGGFYSTQRWRGMLLSRVLDGAVPDRGRARHVSVVSRTGYRWSFALSDADRLLLATHVGNEALSHDHGAPVRLVAPGSRGFEWVKWVERIEVLSEPDYGAPASTVWSSFTRAGRGEA